MEAPPDPAAVAMEIELELEVEPEGVYVEFEEFEVLVEDVEGARVDFVEDPEVL